MRTLTRLSMLMILIGAAVLSSACQPAEPSPTPTAAPISLQDGLGRAVSLPAPAQRIISLAPSNTEILFALGAGAQMVSRDTFSDFPEAAKALPDIGGGFGELNMELILAQKPDLVLASSLTPPEQVQALEDLDIPVFALANPTDFDGLYSNLRAIARLTGREPEANRLIEEIKTRVAAVQTRLAGVQDRPLVFYELDGTDPNAPWTPGPGTYIANLIRMAGGDNLGDALQGDWVQVSIEELLKQDPDIILIGDYTWGGVTPEDVRARAGWEALSAVQNGNLLPFDDNLVSRPGPRVVEGLESMARLLHPELFK